jgi:cysteine desulfurase family protein (TIGR01976 family)
MVMTYDVQAVRAQFPALTSGVAFFDGAGGSQVPRAVADAVGGTLASALSNRGTVNATARRAEEIVRSARAAMADLLGADPRGIVFGRSMTQLTYDFARVLAKSWAPGDEIVITALDHDGNRSPWIQAAEAAGMTVRTADFDPATGELTAADIAAVLSGRTRLVAITGASNLIGTRPPVAEIAALVHDAGALLYLDAVHLTPHRFTDLVELGADFSVCSPYKFCGPHCGVLAADPYLLEGLSPDKLAPSSDAVPERFELGTLPYELLAGTTAAVDFLAGLGDLAAGGAAGPHDGTLSRRDRLRASFDAIGQHELGLLRQLEAGLSKVQGVRVWSCTAQRTPTILLSLAGRTYDQVQTHLAALDVNAPAGSFYALEASRRLGLGDAGAVRVGLTFYNDAQDVERLVNGIAELAGA